uniref:Uncharacterized protein n=1 Tax=Rangifer tarandus platyrhynchus TaxID=3082113 RepID=A0ACB0F8J7_RANTA|nr:unnamed protein product [Rangifer tarandus platyrhynchus]
MEGVLPAPGVHSQLTLEQLGGALLLASERLTRVPGLPLLSWGALVCVVWLLWVLRRRHSVRRGKVPGGRCPAREEVCGRRSQTSGPPTAPADGAPGPPDGEPDAPVPRTPCLSALNAQPSASSHQDTVDFVEKAQKSREPQSPRVTDDRPGLRAFQKSGEQPRPKAVSDLNENALVAERPGLLAQELARWKQRVQEEEEKERLREVSARRQQELEAKVCQAEALARQLLRVFPVPDLLGGCGGDGDVEPAGCAPGQQPEGVLKKVGAGGDLCVSLPGPEPQPQGKARQELEEKRRFARLLRETVRLQREKAALRAAAFQLEHDVQLLKHKLQVLPGQHARLLAELQERELEAETRCLELERRLPATLEDLAAQEEARGIYREMAKRLGHELEVSVTLHRKETLFRERMVWESWMAAEQTWRKFQELRSDNAHLRQELAADLAPSQPCPWGPGAPASMLQCDLHICTPFSGLGTAGRSVRPKRGHLRRQTTPFPAVTPTPDLCRDHASNTLSRQLSA